MTIKEKYSKIENKEMEDDYSNHFYSHFGFYDRNVVRYVPALSKYYLEDRGII